MKIFRKRGCHDCLQYGMCGDPKANAKNGYTCPYWEFRYD